MGFVGFGDFKLSLLIPLFSGIMTGIRIFILFRGVPSSKNTFVTIASPLAEIIVGFFAKLFENIKSKNPKIKPQKKDSRVLVSQYDNSSLSIIPILNFVKAQKKIYNHLFLAFLAFLDALINIFGMIFIGIGITSTRLEHIIGEIRDAKLFYIAVLCCIFIKKPFYKHHLASLILSFIGILINIVIALTLMPKGEIPPFWPLALFGTFSIYFICSFLYVGEKVIMDNGTSFSTVILFEGFYGILESIIIFVILSFISCFSDNYPYRFGNNKLFNFKEAFELLSDRDFLVFFFEDLAVSLFTNSLNKLTILYFSPELLALAGSINIPVSIVLFFITKAKVTQDAFQATIVISYVIGITFGIVSNLIYSEVIIIYCCGLEYDTRKEILIRGDQSLIDIKMNIN